MLYKFTWVFIHQSRGLSEAVMRPIAGDVSGLVKANALLVVPPVELHSLTDWRVAQFAFVSN
jgi:hypothetical protein